MQKIVRADMLDGNTVDIQLENGHIILLDMTVKIKMLEGG
jgi:translation initiation factor IF-1